MHKLKKVVMISHDSFQAGAPILLINLAALLIQTGRYQVSFIIKNNNGVLIPRFEALGPVLIWNTTAPKPSYLQTKLYAVKRKISGSVAETLPAGLPAFIEGADVIISNTITNGDILPAIRSIYKGKIVSYVHELEMASKYFTSAADVSRVIGSSNSFAVPSKAVKNHLISGLNIPAGKTEILNYYIPQINRAAEDKAACRQLLNIPQKGFVVGGVGTSDWRKGADVFIQLALQTKKAGLPVETSFYWFGANETVDLERLKYDVKKMGLQDNVHFIPASNKVPYFFKAIDLFVLTSREDPYPLVVLEAADAAVPIICFEGSGGAPEFVDTDAGSVIAYLDTVAAATVIKNYVLNPALLAEQGAVAQEKVARLHQNQDLIVQQFEMISAQ
ncbi:glycosyltransferase family 4 protein [Mucilaginibacter terrae]|uniref:glycosyltransferase family 4 protein n=1 Tax=Mucilaginibacter terrae TaxID=1955052 RepID=UPI003627CF18